MRRECFLLALALVLALPTGCASSGGGSEPRPAKATGALGSLSRSGGINLSLAQTYLRNGQLETALNRAQRAQSTDPGSGSVHAILGLIYDRIGDQAHAAESFARAMQLSPNEGAVLSAYGTWQCAHGDNAGATASFARAIADPFFTDVGIAHFNSGHCLLRAGNAAQAEVALRRALDARGSDPAAVLMSLAQAELALGKILEARAFVQRREAMGATPDVLELAARIEDAAGDHAAAARYRTRARGDGDGAQPAQEGQGTQPR